MKPKVLIVDGHSMIFQWPDLTARHEMCSFSARESLVRMLTTLQDVTDWIIAVVFDGKGEKPSHDSKPHGVKVFYSKSGQTADSLIERLVVKYASTCDVTVATDDRLERMTVESFGSLSISSRQLRSEIEAAEREIQRAIQKLRKR